MSAISRVARALPGLFNFLGIALIISGVIGLFFIQKPLSESRDTRSDASVASGPVVTSFSPNNGTTLKYDPSLNLPAKLDFNINTAGKNIKAVAYAFNIVSSVLPEAPEVALNQALGLKTKTAEVQKVGDGYLVVVKIVPAIEGASINTNQPTKLLTLNFKPTANGNIAVSFDQEHSYAIATRIDRDEDVMQSLPYLSYPVETTSVVTIGGYSPQWSTPHVSLIASNFYIKANGKTFQPKGSVSVHSDPPSDPTDNYTTLEVSWFETDGTEMRLYMYVYKDQEKWTVEELRTYNGNKPGDWIYYTPPVVSGGANAGQKLSAPIGQAYSPSGDITLKSSRNGIGEVYFNNLNLKAFLATDDLFYEPTATWWVSFKTTTGVDINPSLLEAGKTYLATVDFTVNNLSKTSVTSTQNSNVDAMVTVSGQTTAAKTVSISYFLIAQHAQGGGLRAENISFVAGATNSVSTIIDPKNAYAETNENNNYKVVSYNYQSSGGIKRACNESCSSNQDCGINHRCFDTGSGLKCRLVTNVTSEGCQASSSGDGSSGSSGNSGNSGSPAAVAGCNQACSSNAGCAINTRCFQGACRLATNVSSLTCSPDTDTTISDSYYANQSSPNASDSATLLDESPEEATPDQTSAQQSVDEGTGLGGVLGKLKSLIGESGKLSSVVIGAGIFLILMSVLWAIFGGRKKSVETGLVGKLARSEAPNPPSATTQSPNQPGQTSISDRIKLQSPPAETQVAQPPKPTNTTAL